MNMFTRLATASTLALALAATACSGATAPTAQTSAATTRAPVAQTSHGFVKLFGEALGDVDLRADQRVEIEKLAESAETRHTALRTELKAVMLDIADQVEKGTVDKASLKPKVDRAMSKIDEVRPLDQEALVKLHGLLDEGQRAAFVDALEQRGQKKMEEHKAGGHPMFALAKELDLSSDQRDKIRDAFRDAMQTARNGEGEHEHGFRGHRGGGRHAMLEAFKSPTFDPKTVGPQGSLAEKAKGKEDAAFAMAEKVLPILTAEQRKTLAAKIRARATSEDPFAAGPGL